MKKIILLAFAAVIMVGCETTVERNAVVCNKWYQTIVIDSCEYLSHSQEWDLTHKGNCRFCAERRQRELKELVEQLKSK